MVRTVPRSSVAKWPDSGATSSTRGCSASMSFWKCRSVPNGVTWAASSCTATSRLPTVMRSMPNGGRLWVRPGARDQLVGRGQVAHDAVAGHADGRMADRMAGNAGERRAPAP